MGEPSRALILQNLESDCIVLHEAQVKKQTFSYEIIFRSVNQYFKDAVTSEHFFDIEFFGPKADFYQAIFSESATFLLVIFIIFFLYSKF